MVEQKKLPPLPYTNCFGIEGGEVLMIRRAKRPNKDKDNGLGGKRDYGKKPATETETPDFTEHPDKTNVREFGEESGIDLTQAKSLCFVGIVIWAPISDISDLKTHDQGMYTYVAELLPGQRTWESKETPDGTLAWHKLAWVCDLSNPNVVTNIAYFLPHMLVADNPHLYEFLYEGKEMTGMRISILPEEFWPESMVQS